MRWGRFRIAVLGGGIALCGLLVAAACGLELSGTVGSAASSDGSSGSIDTGPIGDAIVPDGTIMPNEGGIQSGDHVVFVTTAQPTGSIGGLGGADGLCQTEASSSKHPALAGRAFRAWLSDGVTAAAKRYDKPAGRYVLPSGIVVANDVAELTSGTLAHPIIENANGAIAPNTRVWTGTLPDGAPSGSNCNNWLTNLDSLVGTTGYVDASNANWTFQYNEVCSDDWPLYCISQ